MVVQVCIHVALVPAAEWEQGKGLCVLPAPFAVAFDVREQPQGDELGTGPADDFQQSPAQCQPRGSKQEPLRL